MATCSCGRTAAPTDRFCAGCGRPVAPADGDPPAAPPEGDDSLLLDRDGGHRTSSETTVRSGVPTVWLALGVVAVVALMWGLFRWPQTETAGQDRGEAADGDADDGATTTTEPAPEETARTTTTRRGRPTTTERPEVPVPSGPVVGEETGLGLVIGAFSSPADVKILDLDTGVVHELVDVSGSPIAVLDGSLLVRRSSTIRALDLGDPGAEATTIFELGADGWIHVVTPEDDVVWVSYSAGDEDSIVGLDLTGREVDRLEDDDSPFGISRFGFGQVNPELAYHLAGGIYRRVGAGFSRVSDGILLGTGDDVALVHECDEIMRCHSAWYRIDDWERLDHPVPAVGDAWVQVAGGDRWVVTTDWQTERITVNELETGQPLADYAISTDQPFGQSVAISDDGRWLVDTEAGAIVDLDSSAAWPLEPNPGIGSTLLFIDLEAVGFDR